MRERDKNRKIIDRAELSQSLSSTDHAEMGGLETEVPLISVAQAGELCGAHREGRFSD